MHIFSEIRRLMSAAGKVATFFLLVAFLSFTPVNAANQVDIDVYTVQDSIPNGFPNAIEISIENDFVLGGMSLGFRVWSPDGVSWTWYSDCPGEVGPSGVCVVTQPGSRADASCVFDLTGLLVTAQNIDGISPDTLSIGGVALMCGLQPGPMEHMYSIYFTPNSPEYYQTLCIDSSFVPPSGAFAFVDAGGGAHTPTVLWPNGGICWPVGGHYHCYAEWESGLPQSMTVGKCESSGSVTLSAFNPTDPDYPLDYYLYDLVGGAGTAIVTRNIDNTCDVSYTPAPEDIGQEITIRIDADCDGCPSSLSIFDLDVNVINNAPVLDSGFYYVWGATNNPVTKDDIFCTDADTCDEPLFSIISGPGEIDPASGLYTWIPGPGDSGTFIVTIDVNDGAEAVEGSFQVGIVDETCCPGDVNFTGDVNVGDAVSLINYIFKGGHAPKIMNWADPNADCLVNVGDVVYLIAYVFRGGPSPQTGCYYSH